MEAVTVTILDGPNAGISTQTRSRLRGVTAMTDADGFYQLTNLVGGGFTVQFSKDGYRLARRGVDIRTNLTENVELEALAPPSAPAERALSSLVRSGLERTDAPDRIFRPTLTSLG